MKSLEAQEAGRDTAFVRKASKAAAHVGLLAFWVGILIAASRYPSEYDWRYIPLSYLFAAKMNPAGYVWAAAGMVLCSVGLSWWALSIRRWTQDDDAIWPIGPRALQFGAFCMVFVPLPASGFPLHKGHEIIAIAAFSGLCLGIGLMSFQVFERTLQWQKRWLIRNSRLFASLLAGTSVLSVALAGLAQLYVYYTHPTLHWVNISWRTNGIPPYLSFAFWEWVTCAVLSGYMAILALTAGSTSVMRLETRSR